MIKGIANLSNNCFMNTSLHALFNIPDFNMLIIQKIQENNNIEISNILKYYC